MGDPGHLNTIFTHLHDKHSISRHGTPQKFLEYIRPFGVPSCACGCGKNVELHCRKFQYNLFAAGCEFSGRFKNPSCAEFHLFNGKSVDETIRTIRAVQSKAVSSRRRIALSNKNSGASNPMSLDAISKRTGLSVATVKKMLSNKNSGSLNGFYGRRHKPETLARLAKSRSIQFKLVTKPEIAIWGMLKALDIEFEYQAAIDRYVVDFLLNGRKVVEVFGDYWHHKNMKSSQKRANDEAKIKKLKALGYAVLVIWESRLFLETQETIGELKSFEANKDQTS